MNKKTKYLLLSSIFILFVALRLAFITQKNLWFDEVFSWHIIQGSFYDIIARTSADIHPPLYYFILKIWNTVFGDSVFSMRLLSTVFSAISLFFIYPTAKKVLNPSFKIIFLLLFALNPLNIFYSQEVRMSAMNLFLNAGSVYFLLRLIGRNYIWLPDFRQNDYYLYVLFRAAALYTHYFSFIIFIAEAIFVIITHIIRPQDIGKPKSFKTYIAGLMPFVVSFGSVILFYLPWLPAFYEHSTRGQSWRTTQTLSMALDEVINYIKDLNMGLYYHYTDLRLIKFITVFLIIVYSVTLIILLLSILRRSLPSGNSNTANNQFFIPFTFVVIPVAIGIVISLNQKVEFYRYFSIIIPFVLMFILYGISKIEKKYIVYPVIILILMINIFGITSGFSFNFKNDDYRPLINNIEHNFKEGDRVYVEPHYMGWSIDYYKEQWDLKLPSPVYIRYGWNEILDSLSTQKPERFWLILDYSAVDTAKYTEYITGLKEKNNIEERTVYFLAPTKVELYRFKVKTPDLADREFWEVNPEPLPLHR